MNRLFFSLIIASVVWPSVSIADTRICQSLHDSMQTLAARDHCLPLAEQGDGKASFIMSSLYSQGIGVKDPDLQQALLWLNRSAQQNHGPACYNLAALYERGEVLGADLPSAFNWYTKGAELGHVPSQLKIGTFYLRGIGTETDFEKARHWLTLAAEAEDQSAQVTLATLLSTTEPEQSLELYKKAAAQDNAYALHQLALIYSEGRLGQPVHLEQALAYASESVRLGRLSGKALVLQLTKQMEPASESEQRLPTTIVSVQQDQPETDVGQAADPVANTAVVETVKVSEASDTQSSESTISNVATEEVTTPELALNKTALNSDAQNLDTQNPGALISEPSDKKSHSDLVAISIEPASKIEKRAASDVRQSQVVSDQVMTASVVAAKKLVSEPDSKSDSEPGSETDSEPNSEQGSDKALPTVAIVESVRTEKSVSIPVQQSGLRDKAWLMAQPGQDYVLQLVQLTREESVKAYIKANGLEGRVNYFRAHTNAGRVFVVLYSKTNPSLSGAKNIALDNFPESTRKQIWYRSYLTIQKSYRPAD
ncbi:SEL1-like repeat protein [Amphritea balenae]|uniref:SPOR domain-containing protein n=1 Tax=Amphritea balenae TaxID=452629 RepID=A0A3P1SS61_9GAMM|nr:SEL1-like repeat protein [Amphritea balenae]RRC99950.1 hypothetical protein EHS89_06955 [Amphritea balenae]GGK75358.1 hypothetical protein GCM10007941_26820 [Amphritea balenae]